MFVEQSWYNSKHNLVIKGILSISKAICLKVNAVGRLRFEIAYNDVSVQHVSHNTSGTPNKKTYVLGRTQNCIWSWVSSSEDIGKLLFIDIPFKLFWQGLVWNQSKRRTILNTNQHYSIQLVLLCLMLSIFHLNAIFCNLSVVLVHFDLVRANIFLIHHFSLSTFSLLNNNVIFVDLDMKN